jgi:hypothetical protein
MTAPASEIVHPRAYQQTHALTELAVKKVDQFGVCLTEACVKLEDLERENNRVWKYLKQLHLEHTKESKENAKRLLNAQRAAVFAFACACVSTGMAFVMVILWGMK